MKYAIYQLKSGEDQRDLRFLNLKNLLKLKKTPEYSDYACVYTGIIKKGTRKENMPAVLSHLYETFNLKRPKDFEGHSLSVSDIIVIEQNTGKFQKAEAFYVDTFGFKECEEFAIEHMINQNKEHMSCAK